MIHHRLDLALPALWVQVQAIPAPPDLPNPKTGGNLQSVDLAHFFNSRTPYEFWLTCIILAFGLITIILLLSHFRSVPNRNIEDVARATTVVIVIVGTLVLVTAGYSNDQIAPAFGLFGTIMGYMLGKLGTTHANREPPSDRDVTPRGPQ
jgi:glycerol uptake facilitator-like aquaporin